MRHARLLINPIIWIGLMCGPLLVDEWQLSELSQRFSYGILAMSLAFVWGQAGLLCFGQAIFFGVGAYAMALITKGMVPGIAANTLIGLFAAIVIPALFAYVSGLLLFRGRALSGAYFAIVTLSAAAIVELAASHTAFIGGFNGLMNIPPLRFGGTEVFDAVPVYYIMLAATGVAYAVLLFIERSAAGTVLRAIRDDEVRTAYFGYDVSSHKTFAFALSAAV